MRAAGEAWLVRQLKRLQVVTLIPPRVAVIVPWVGSSTRAAPRAAATRTPLEVARPVQGVSADFVSSPFSTVSREIPRATNPIAGRRGGSRRLQGSSRHSSSWASAIRSVWTCFHPSTCASWQGSTTRCCGNGSAPRFVPVSWWQLRWVSVPPGRLFDPAMGFAESSGERGIVEAASLAEHAMGQGHADRARVHRGRYTRGSRAESRPQRIPQDNFPATRVRAAGGGGA